MRITADLLFSEPTLLEWNYLDWLRGLLYRAMKRGNPEIAQIVHEEGFGGGERQYKLITFSLLDAEQYQATPSGLQVEGIVQWRVSSPLDTVVGAVRAGLLGEPAVRIGFKRASVREVRIEPPPAYSEQMTYSCLSPICVSTLREENGQLRRPFLSPDDPDFGRILNENLKRKANALHQASLEGELAFRWLSPPRSRLFSVAGTRIRGWTLTFQATGPIPLQRIAYEAGFGERNAQGFGMVQLAKSSPSVEPRLKVQAGAPYRVTSQSSSA